MSRGFAAYLPQRTDSHPTLLSSTDTRDMSNAVENNLYPPGRICPNAGTTRITKTGIWWFHWPCSQNSGLSPANPPTRLRAREASELRQTESDFRRAVALLPLSRFESIGITHSAYAALRRFAATVGP